jgi:energy-coupling factor transport system ATP-binding protein
MSDPIVVATDLTHTYRSGPAQPPALAGISLQIARGSCVAILGATGSGKSTLVQHFNGLLRPTSGSLVVDGVEIHARDARPGAGRSRRSAPRAESQSLRRRVGMLFQSPEAQLFAPTVLADVAFGPRRMGLAPHEVAERVRAALDTVELDAAVYGGRSPFDLSGGQMRRVALAGVLALEPTILALDEPTVGLDAEARAEFYAYVRRAQRERGVTVILISHDMAEVATLAEQLFVLHAGRLVAHGLPQAVFARGEQLREWGLLAPPLAELLALLRAAGMTIPPEVRTVEGALVALRRQVRHV